MQTPCHAQGRTLTLNTYSESESFVSITESRKPITGMAANHVIATAYTPKKEKRATQYTLLPYHATANSLAKLRIQSKTA